MHSSPARWTRAAAAAALLTLPLTAAAQPQDKKVDAAAAKQHLSEARDTLSQLTATPEAARLQGDARTQVSQLISNFNDLITTQSDWRSAYAKVDANLTALLGPANPANPANPAPLATAGAKGTSGVMPPSPTATMPPADQARAADQVSHADVD